MVHGHGHARIDILPGCPIPEVAQLGRTLRAWPREPLGYFDTGGASNGPVEAVNLHIERTRRVGHGTEIQAESS